MPARPPPLRDFDPRPRSYFFVKIDFNVTASMFMTSLNENQGLFRFLDKNGSFITTESGDPEACVEWGKALEIADHVGAFYIINYSRRKILCRSARGRGTSWVEAVIYPDTKFQAYCTKPLPPPEHEVDHD